MNHYIMLINYSKASILLVSYNRVVPLFSVIYDRCPDWTLNDDVLMTIHDEVELVKLKKMGFTVYVYEQRE